MSNIDDYFANHKFTDDFGWSPDWNEEADKWLEVIKNVDSSYYDIFENRANKLHGEEHRDGLLGEIKSIYFISHLMGLKIIDFEPEGINSTKLDFTFEDVNKELWKAEVKSPSWRGQVWKNPNMTVEEKKARILQPKVRNGEGRWFSATEELSFALEDSVKNALPKFRRGENNLLIVVPDMFLETIPMLAIASMGGVDDPIEEELRLILDPEGIISSVLVLEPILPSDVGKVVYHHKLAPIIKAPQFSSKNSS